MDRRDSITSTAIVTVISTDLIKIESLTAIAPPPPLEQEDCGDYDVVIAMTTSAEQVVKNNNYNGRHYGLERLDSDANDVVDDCSQYENSNQNEAGDDKRTTRWIDSAALASLIDDKAATVIPIIGNQSTEEPETKRLTKHRAASRGRVPVLFVLVFLVGYICKSISYSVFK